MRPLTRHIRRERMKHSATTYSLSSPGLTGRPSTPRPFGSIAGFPAYWIARLRGDDTDLANSSEDTHERAAENHRRSRHRFRAPPYRPLAPRHRGDAGERRREQPRRVDGPDAAVLDPAEGAARSRARVQRNRGAGAYARARRAKPGVHLADRPGLFRHHPAGGDPAQHSGEPGLVHGLYAVSAGDQPGPAGSAVQFPDHDLRPHRARRRQRLAAR